MFALAYKLINPVPPAKPHVYSIQVVGLVDPCRVRESVHFLFYFPLKDQDLPLVE